MKHLNKVTLLPLLLAGMLSAQEQNSYTGVSTPPVENMSTVATSPARPSGKATTTVQTEKGSGETTVCTVQPNPTLVRRTEAPAPLLPPAINPLDTQMAGEGAHGATAAKPQTEPKINPMDRQMVADNMPPSSNGSFPSMNGMNLPQGVHLVPAPRLPTGTRLPIVMTTDLSTDTTPAGKIFRGKLAKDVTLNGKVLIPKGSEVRGRVTSVQNGIGEKAMMRLRPDTVVLPDGSRYQIHAQVSDPKRDNVHVGNEGAVVANSPVKHDGVVYGGSIGSGALIGTMVAGPAGTVVGAIAGAGVATTHAIFHHNRVNIPQDSSLELALTEPMDMVPTIN
jgi:hypothetical protein